MSEQLLLTPEEAINLLTNEQLFSMSPKDAEKIGEIQKQTAQAQLAKAKQHYEQKIGELCDRLIETNQSFGKIMDERIEEAKKQEGERMWDILESYRTGDNEKGLLFTIPHRDWIAFRQALKGETDDKA